VTMGNMNVDATECECGWFHDGFNHIDIQKKWAQVKVSLSPLFDGMYMIKASLAIKHLTNSQN